MAVARRQPDLAATRRAFDAVADAYDADNRRNLILEWMRRRGLAMLMREAAPSSHVLDLGCGPGTDFVPLVAAGYRVTAIDGSARMVEQARAAARRASPDGHVRVHHLGIEALQQLPSGRFDAAFSGFGPLNCVPDLPSAARLIATRLRPGGVLVASVIGRWCPWELACYLWKRDWLRLTVRFAGDFVPVPLGAETIWTRYYSPAQFEQPFLAAGFRRVALRSLGLLVPPPYLHTAAARYPRLTSALQTAEDQVAGWPGLRSLGDHFLMALRRC